jgi:hypothetical protein
MTRAALVAKALVVSVGCATSLALAARADAQPVDLSAARIAVPAGADRGAERLAAGVLAEEIARRTGLTWPVGTSLDSPGVTVAIAVGAVPAWGARVPAVAPRAEGYRLVSSTGNGHSTLWIVGADARGVLYGVGDLLRTVDWQRSSVTLTTPVDVATSPRYAIRGHQLGYRHHSNTYDGWDEARYDQYVRELVLLGANAVENIPFQDTRVSPLMPLSREAMNRALSAICAKYGVDYWLWTPADFDLRHRQKRDAALAALDGLFAGSPRIDAVFVPGGDPGDNPADVVLPYLGDLALRLRRHHPKARVWLSLQHFDRNEVDSIFAWIDREHPEWLGGLVAGPSSFPIPETRRRLDRGYALRDYPDIGHTVRSQYPVPRWDPAFNFTLGREPVNPRPVFYARVHDTLAPHTDGFISYSDGVNDDVNKAVWTRKAWDPDRDLRAIVLDYTRLFFGARVAERAADGLLALERNWDGPLAGNGSVDDTLALWEQIEAGAPELAGNWRWQLHLMRAYYDAYTRRRLAYETGLESDALTHLASAAAVGTGEAMSRAEIALARATTANCCPAWRARIEALCDALFESIRLQTSLKRHSASGAERGAVLDFLDHPLNNRWWLEDQFAGIRASANEPERRARLAALAAWSRPGEGSFYDDVGDVGRSPHVEWGEATPHFTWEGGPSRKRLSWLTSLRWPAAIVYTDLDPTARYVVRLNVMKPGAPGIVYLRIDGERVEPSRAASVAGEPVEFAVPPAALADGRLTLTFDEVDESQLNWRQHSRLTEAWLIRR